MQTLQLRLAYMLEFLVAVIAILSFWSQAGGQGHLDLMPWYYIFFPTLALAYFIVQATVAAVSRQQAWNRQTFGWIGAAIAVVLLMAGLTYYYHLHEDDDSPIEGGAVAAAPACMLCSRPPEGANA